MTVWMLLAFATVAFIGIATPGPTVLLALANGSRFGFRCSLWGMLGAVLSDFVLIGAVAIGLGALLAASEFWFMVLKWVGVGYLAFIGLQMLRSKGSLDVSETHGTAGGTPRALFLKSFLVAVTNPKGYLFFTAFLPQFVVATEPQLPQYAALAIIFALLDLVIMAGYASLGAQAMKLLTRRGLVWLDRTCGGALLALAGTLAFYRKTAN
ncbi:LysE family translocator [Hoeflea sp.]|uniref:LysE family translocator n=1 Tax=Hoeflea sp. TaxID=1940281 RepID=UPI003A912C98